MNIFIFFNSKILDLENVGNKAFGKSLNSKFLKESIPIPVPPIDIQKQIISEVDKLDKEYQNSRMTIEGYREEIKNIFNKLGVLKVEET